MAELAARGLSNPEIALELFLSRRTVESHLSSSLHKIGLKRRAQLAHAWETIRAGADSGENSPG